jgi:enediyne biosynthesis protein E4
MLADRYPLRPGCRALILLLGIFAGTGGCRRVPETAVEEAGDTAPPRHATVFDNLAPATKEALVRGSDGEILPELYRDVTALSGVDFAYRNGQEADHYTILETLGGGVALIDYDGDGLLDIFVTGGGYFSGPEKKEIHGHPCRLYKNLGHWQFKDVTREAGLDQLAFYTHGAAVADYDRDGWPDLVVTGWGGLALFRNEPDGKGGRRFRDVTRQAGLTERLWSTSAAWTDLDGDGFPDLYVCQYADWSFANNPQCKGSEDVMARDVCPPSRFHGLPHRLYHNSQHGTFTEVSRAAGLRPHTGDPQKDKEPGLGLGVVVLDLDGDGKPDIYVANDGVGNFLYRNRSTPGRLRFDEIGVSSGVAFNDRGTPDGSMGTDAGDYEGSGRPSLWVANYEDQLHALYRNIGRGLFVFNTTQAGIAAIGQSYVGFGTGFLDLDHHGWEDLVVVNGHVLRHPHRAQLRQRPVLLRNQGNGRFRDITSQGGSYFRDGHIARGLAIGDLDNDGRPDLVISHQNEPVVLLRNEAGAGRHWLGIELAGKGRRDVVGARVVVEAGGLQLTRFAKGGSSYLSSGDRRLVFGLNTRQRVERVTVFWPWGREQSWAGDSLTVDRYWSLREGEGSARELTYP